MTRYWCEHAWLPDGPSSGVAITVQNGQIAKIEKPAPRAGITLNGLVMPGFCNAHSHAFHRALRGRTHSGGGTFWTWREQMYAVAERLDPDSYYRLARAVYAEMVLAGYTSVGEFHYLHHAPGGHAYGDPNAMSHALSAAAADAGIRLTLLDTCYLTAGLDGQELDPVQRRFSDGDADRWAERVDLFAPDFGTVGAAVHSVRAVPAKQIPVVAAWAASRGAPLHAHVSEQRAENEACRSVYGRSPTELLDDAGALGEAFTAVHATHLSTVDVELLGRSGVCSCPTTERDLGDGIGPMRQLARTGAALSIGSDSHAVIDPFAELLAMETHERLATESRGHFTARELVAAGSRHSALGAGGELAVGRPADLIAVDLDSVRTAGSAIGGIPFCATESDVRDVMIGGEWIVRDGRHERILAPAHELSTQIEGHFGA